MKFIPCDVYDNIKEAAYLNNKSAALVEGKEKYSNT